MGIERLGQVYNRVDDLSRAGAFYHAILGLRLESRDGGRWAAFDVGGITFALEGGARAMGEAAGATVRALVAFRVAGPDELVERLSRAGYVGDRRVDVGARERRIELEDPSGHPLALCEPLPPPS